MRTVYAINPYTKHYCIVESNAEINAFKDTDYTIYESPDGWIPWHGGYSSPVPSDCKVDIVLRDNDILYDQDIAYDNLAWRHRWGIADIIAYRPVLANKCKHNRLQVGDKVQVRNDENLPMEYGQHVVGEVAYILALFEASGNVDMAVVEYDRCCYAFRTSMLKPVPTEEEELLEDALNKIAVEHDEDHAIIEKTIRYMLEAGYTKNK